MRLPRLARSRATGGVAVRQHRCSISWGVVADGELVLTGAHAAEPDPLPTERTVFRIASMTKSFTAASILILRDRGLLRLDDVGGRHRARVRRSRRSDQRLAGDHRSSSAVDGRRHWRRTTRGPIGTSTSPTRHSTNSSADGADIRVGTTNAMANTRTSASRCWAG